MEAVSMDESSVSSDFMALLRKHHDKPEVIKHKDSTMIGLVDCSVTGWGRTSWIEFKFLKPTRTWDMDDTEFLLERAVRQARESKTQYALAGRLMSKGRMFYMTWVKKSKRILFWLPDGVLLKVVETNAQAVEYAVSLARAMPMSEYSDLTGTVDRMIRQHEQDSVPMDEEDLVTRMTL